MFQEQEIKKCLKSELCSIVSQPQEKEYSSFSQQNVFSIAQH